MKTVLITGGSRGIGRAMVELFCENGYKVAFTYKNSESQAKNLAETMGAVAIKADSASEAEVVEAVKAAENALGKIDCLINNAGISSFSLFTDLTLEEWNRHLAVNLTGAFLYSRAVIPGMVSRKRGRIINITSMWGIVGSSCEVHYSTAKAGLIGMTKALAKELGPSGITVNAIAPGLIATDMNACLSEEDINEVAEETPLMRVGLPSEVARAALFLASEGASFITGEVMNLSGGYIM
ncbi:MAG: 3-oxoacyl-ACP reductase FabG [Clostridia bacterium]|nr:3-oxoacyl-ACP reductase FabG [Clostridia bacterium]